MIEINDMEDALRHADAIYHFIDKQGRKHFTKSDTTFAYESMKRVLDIFEGAIIREAYGRPLVDWSEL